MHRTGADKASAKGEVDLSKGATSPQKWVESLQGRYWVEDRFRGLQRKNVDESDYATFNGLMELAWQLHIVTKCTAMLALEGETMYAEHSVRRSQPGNTSVSPWTRTKEALAKQLTPKQLLEAREKQREECKKVKREIRWAQSLSEDQASLRAKLAALKNRPDLQWPESVKKQWDALLADQEARQYAPDVSYLLGPLEGVGLTACVARDLGPINPTQTVFRALSTDEDALSYLKKHVIKDGVKVSGDLRTIVSALAKQSTVPIELNWSSICIFHPDADSEEWTDVLHGSLSQGLNAMVTRARSRGIDIGWTVVDGKVLIDTPEQLNSILIPRAYPIEDMLRRVCYIAGRYTPDRWRRNGRGGGGLFGDEDSDTGEPLPTDGEMEEYWQEEYAGDDDYQYSDDDYAEDVPLTRTEVSWKLADVIKQMVDNESWYPNGEATMNTFGESLLINQTPQNHRKIQRLLTMVRRTNPRNSTHVKTMSHESPFDRYRRVRPWVATLLKKAREGKLGKYSSIKTRTVGKTIYARICGIWMDTRLKSGDILMAIEPESLAGSLVIPCLPIGDEIDTFGPLVIYALNGDRGYALESGGLSDT